MFKNKNTFIPKACYETDINYYLPKINIYDTISKKMNKLCELSGLSQTDLAGRRLIHKYILNLFQDFYPDCSLIIFGSSINGFGTNGCDMDVMFCPSPDYEYLDASEINADVDVPTVKEAKRNPSVLAQLKYMTKEKQLRFLLRVLRSKRHEIKGAMYIPAKCPIVRFYISHEYYSIWIDLSLQQGLPKFNSDLFQVFSMVDSRVRSLMITLRFWAKYLKIVNVGAFSSYAFSLLVIFFLQNVEDPLLPPVNDLMINADSCVVDGWEVGFVSDVVHDFVSRNTLSEEELLKEFFKFYWNFDFARNVVCIRTGKATPISDIGKDADERMKNFVIADVCVQDPFILSHNVTGSLKLFRMHLLKPYFFVANLILSKQLQSPEHEDIFQLLYKRELYESKIQEDFFFLKSGFDIECFHMYPNCEIVATIGDNFEKIWYEQVCQAIRDILEYILFFDCEVIDKNYLFTNTDFRDDYSESNQKHGKLLLSIQCAIDNRVWKYRNTKPPFPLDSYKQNFTNEVLKEENALSHFLLASSPTLQFPGRVFWFLCNCYQSKYSQIPYMWINFIPLCPNFSEFRSVCKILKSFIPKTIDKMLKKQCF